MEPIIYDISATTNKENKLDIKTKLTPNIKLIKYGFNNISRIDTNQLTSNDHYKVGLEYNFEDTSADSIFTLGKKSFGIDNFDKTFAELWEIVSLFELFKKNKKIYYIENNTTLETITSVYKTFNPSDKITIDNKNPSLIIYKYSAINIEEDTAIKFILKNITNILNKLTTGSNLIMQIFDLQTAPIVELIYLLSIMFEESYIIKPAICSSIDYSKYIILLNKKSDSTLEIPTVSDDEYIETFGISVPIDFEIKIQCLNSQILPKRYALFNKIKSYLNTKVYEGATYQELLQDQHNFSNKWIETFSKTDNLSQLLTDILNKSNSTCHNHSNLINIYN